MRKSLLTLSSIVLFMAQSKAQVEDVSVFVTPTLGYNWFDSKSTVNNGLMYGFQVGFGFGRVIELRGIYEHSANLKQSFGAYQDDVQSVIPGFSFANRTVTVTRTGGEFKANIPTKRLSPYLILGTGIQKFERTFNDSTAYSNQNLYGSGGLGLKFNIGQRLTLNVEGRGIVYNMNPNSLLYNEGGTSQFDDWVNNQDRQTMYNWSLQGGLQFYFGGRVDKNMSEMDKAYLRRFSGGLSGMKFTLAPMGAYLNFNPSSAYRDAYMLGGQLGIDITDFVGIKAYYLQGTDGENPSLNFDKIGLLGIDFIGNLNVARGIYPFITVGGGYINVQKNYQGRNIGTNVLPVYAIASSSYYAKGGLGMTVPLGKYVDAFGAVNLMYTIDSSKVDVLNLSNANQLQQHMMYNVGLRLKIGKKANSREATQAAFENRFTIERYQYEQKLKTLEAELRLAYDKNDITKVTQIIEEKKALEIMQQEGVQSVNPAKDSMIRMTPAELQKMINETIEKVEKETTIEDMELRMVRLEQLMNQLNLNRVYAEPYYHNSLPQTPPKQPSVNLEEMNQRLEEEMNSLKKKLEEQSQTIEALKAQQQTNNAADNK